MADGDTNGFFGSGAFGLGLGFGFGLGFGLGNVLVLASLLSSRSSLRITRLPLRLIGWSAMLVLNNHVEIFRFPGVVCVMLSHTSLHARIGVGKSAEQIG